MVVEVLNPTIDEFSKTSYLDYAMSVITGRAIPSVSDGQKPVQRRALYVMFSEMGLGPTSKHVKSARAVGDIIGKYHPHGEVAVYDAMVRMAQDFITRYPLIDGQGNFGSRDGDSPAAPRYTEMRPTAISELLVSEIQEDTVQFRPNYDGTLQEPVELPARLPFVVLNGASGIAVGMATEIPSHNLTEIAEACITLLKSPTTSSETIISKIPGPDFAGGGQIISSREVIENVYRTGRGSIRVRAIWEIERFAKGEWKLVVTALPPGVTTTQILTEIEQLSNPQGKTSNEKNILKSLVLSLIDVVRDESSKESPIRIVVEPKTRRVDIDSLVSLLLAHTSLEINVPINLTVVGRDSRARCYSLPEILKEWVGFRVDTVRLRTQSRLNKLNERIHILEGRLKALLNIDEVIRVIRESDDPEHDLIDNFQLSEIQAQDILNIRLRQLARLADIEIQKELQDKRKEAGYLSAILEQEGESDLRKLVISEIKSDVKRFGDSRRTLIQEDRSSSAIQQMSILTDKTSDPLTIIVSKYGWIRSRTGHEVNKESLSFKEGDSLWKTFETYSNQNLVVLDSTGRTYSLIAGQIPGGKGDGIPIVSQFTFPSGAKIIDVIMGDPESRWLVCGSHGYGFIAQYSSMLSRNKTGKVFLTVASSETPLPLLEVTDLSLSVTCFSEYKLLTFPIEEIKELPKGKGVKLIELQEKESLKRCFYTSLIEDVPVSSLTASKRRRGSRGILIRDGVQGKSSRSKSGKSLPTDPLFGEY